MKIPDAHTVFNSYLTLHMIDDRMTLLDPVEELCLFTSKETSARCLSDPGPTKRNSGRDRSIGKGVLLYSQWHHGKSAATPLSSVDGSQLNAIYFESSRREIHGWVPTAGTTVTITMIRTLHPPTVSILL
ncbi:hypothetical protein GOODEAATRI_018581 [Goodea atripinnis]|uniref:Uncharacterized protein n=1 Tax=Goodea atripinnis TaxID=208336 RepID=A0ABV0MLY5_9TELE